MQHSMNPVRGFVQDPGVAIRTAEVDIWADFGDVSGHRPLWALVTFVTFDWGLRFREGFWFGEHPEREQ